jgi:hypothetical protein
MTTPTGKLMWGQAGAYDGIDDRAVIAALTANRTGLTWPATIVAGSGLTMTVKAGWLGVVSCGDGTSAVVGSRTDQQVTGLAGPATGSRVDYIWCDVQPDSGTWSLTVINASAAAGRTGLVLATLTVPANATLASQFTIAGADSLLERRLLCYVGVTESNTRTGNSFTSVGAPIITPVITFQPARWYRVKFMTMGAVMLTGGPDLRSAIGQRAPGQNDTQATYVQGGNIAIVTGARPTADVLEYVFRLPAASAPVQRQYDGRIFITGSGSFKTCGGIQPGNGLSLSVEDMGT